MSTSNRITVLIIVLCVSCCGNQASLGDDSITATRQIEAELIPLRIGGVREWSDFPDEVKRDRLQIPFNASRNTVDWTLLVRQQDVKQQWFVTLNGTRLGELIRDENDTIISHKIPAGTLNEGRNALVFESSPSLKNGVDDIRVGQITLYEAPAQKVLSQSAIVINVTDADSTQPVPCRITIRSKQGALQCLGTESNDELAVRPGTVYTGTGHAEISLPAGTYLISAGRGFEYSVATDQVTLSQGQTSELALSIRREVSTEGFVCCDTHVHTLTHSRHGDARIGERMLTLAGEGIELPIATDHNCQIDYEAIALQLKVRKYFTPVVGNEVTTPRGHFNIFPARADASIPDQKQTDWGILFDDIYRKPEIKIAILNHARDLHSGVRPFGPLLFNAVVGENLDGWPMRFNAMEVVNSGATQTDSMRLFHDWMGLLNCGHMVTPVGSSDSHDVSRYIVGQGRTYIRCDDRDPAKISLDEAVNNFLQGRVMVSYGLLADLTINQKYHSGELATTPDEEVQVDIRVQGPHWVSVSRVLLYANGRLIREEVVPEKIDAMLPTGTKWKASWKLPRPRHDVHLVAIAVGPGIDEMYWKTARPYQPVSIDWEPHVIGCSGTVWLDVDNDSRRTSARDYAARLIATHRDNTDQLIKSLDEYDTAVASHAAYLLLRQGITLTSESIQKTLKSAKLDVQIGFREFLDAWRESEIARSSR